MDMKENFYILSTYISLNILCDVLVRVFQLLWIIKSDDTKKDTMTLLRSCFCYNKLSIMTISITGTLFICQVIYANVWPFKYIWEYNTAYNVFSLMFVIILLRLIDFYSNNAYQDSINVNSMKGLDYGTGMAYSYYYGYLRIVLPSTGTASKGICEKLETFENIHNIQIPIKKLFILIPSSMHIPSDLKEASDGWMESAVKLEDEKRDRAGIKGRSYRNNIYKIYPGCKRTGIQPKYVAVEGATPLLTFFEVQKHAHPEASTYKKYSKEIIKTFYLKLQELLHTDEECRHICELIHYDDYKPDGSRVNVAEIILDRIK